MSQNVPGCQNSVNDTLWLMQSLFGNVRGWMMAKEMAMGMLQQLHQHQVLAGKGRAAGERGTHPGTHTQTHNHIHVNHCWRVEEPVCIPGMHSGKCTWRNASQWEQPSLHPAVELLLDCNWGPGN